MPYKDPAKEREKKRRWFAKKCAEPEFHMRERRRRWSPRFEYRVFNMDTEALKCAALTRDLSDLGIPFTSRLRNNHATIRFAKRHLEDLRSYRREVYSGR